MGGTIHFASGHVRNFLALHQGMPAMGARYLLFLKKLNSHLSEYEVLWGAAYEMKNGRVYPLDDLSSEYEGIPEPDFLAEVHRAIAAQNEARGSTGDPAQERLSAGVALYNAGKMKEAIEPLRKATELDPRSSQAWYLLGAALVGSAEFKQVGETIDVAIQPGTVEAYQKAVELDPDGMYGQQAKTGLEALQQILGTTRNGVTP
jgi:tetratricopeptide (TPR) repeat protein